MSYQSNIWAPGDLITSQRLNNIEEKIVSREIYYVAGHLIENTENLQLDITPVELMSILRSHTMVMIKIVISSQSRIVTTIIPVTYFSISSPNELLASYELGAGFSFTGNLLTFRATTENDFFVSYEKGG